MQLVGIVVPQQIADDASNLLVLVVHSELHGIELPEVLRTRAASCRIVYACSRMAAAVSGYADLDLRRTAIRFDHPVFFQERQGLPSFLVVSQQEGVGRLGTRSFC